MFIQIISIMIASFMQTTKLGLNSEVSGTGLNLGYIFSLLFLIKSFKYLLSFKFYHKTFIQIILSIALFINLFLKIIFEVEFRTLSSFIVLLSYFSFIVTLNFFSVKQLLSVNKSHFYRSIDIFYNRIFYPFLVIEFLTRLLLIKPSLPWFYAIKDSFFYFDANFLGLYLLLSCLLVTILTDLNNKHKHIFIHLIFIILSTSRSSIICAGFLLLLIKYKSLGSKIYRLKLSNLLLYNKIFKIISFVIFSIFIWNYNHIIEFISQFIVENFTGLDGSLNSKIDLFNNIQDFLLSDNYQGIGFGNYINVYSIWSHSLLNMSIVEGGVINFILLFSLLCFSFSDSLVGIMILIIVLLQGLSVFSYNIIALGVVISAYALIDKKKLRNSNEKSSFFCTKLHRKFS